MEDSLFDRLPVLEVLDHDALQQRRRHFGIPDTLRIDDDDRTIAADAEARCLAALDALWTKEQILALQQVGKERVDLAPTTVGRAEAAGAHEYVARVGLHLRPSFVTHQEKIHVPMRAHTCTAVDSP